MSELLSVKAAQTRLLETVNPLGFEIIHIGAGVGRTLARDVQAKYNLPPFANSSMDGFAVRTDDITGASRTQPIDLQVVGDIPAGVNWQGIVKAGQSVRIMTGAPLPEGADAVVPVEETDFNYRDSERPLPERVQIFTAVPEGAYIRPRGQDVGAGEIVLSAGKQLKPQDIGFLAMLGIPEVAVYRIPSIAVFSSGDELLPVEEELRPGMIHDANTYLLKPLLEKFGAKVYDLGIAPDQAQAVREKLNTAVDLKVDLIVSSAGVSVGAFDFVRMVVETEGELDFWRVNMRPGKPFTYGSYRGIPFVGLPGNPVSAFVGCQVFVYPLIQRFSGRTLEERKIVPAVLAEAVYSDGRESYLRGILAYRDGNVFASLTGHQGSGNLRSLTQANALLIIPSEVKFLPPGSEVQAWLLD